jgi:hypothetical protein
MHGFCHKVNMFAEGGRPNNLEFAPFVEIMDVYWASDAKPIQDVPATPVKKEVKPEVASTRGKRKITFDPFADLGMGPSLTFRESWLLGPEHGGLGILHIPSCHC